MTQPIPFALNHVVAPSLPPAAFFQLCRALEVTMAEIRNDLSGNAILDGTPASEMRRMAADHGVSLISINALQRFNEWMLAREKEALELAAFARAAGAAALVLVPVNDGSGREDGVRQENLRKSLRALKPILDDHGIQGLVEPLGFQICSLRSKREAVEAIEDVGGGEIFRLVHDTFHHHIAGEPALFAARTGLVHISGVTDRSISVGDMRDPHRVLVDENDRIDNLGQLRALVAEGYDGPASFEPFSPSVHALADLKAALASSMGYLRAHL